MIRKTKTISMDGVIVEAIENLAKAEKRSFTRQVEVLLEGALIRRNDVLSGKTQIDITKIKKEGLVV